MIFKFKSCHIQSNLFTRLHLEHPFALPEYSDIIPLVIIMLMSPVMRVGVRVSWGPEHPSVCGVAAPALPGGVHHDVAGCEARPRHTVVTGEHQGHLVTHVMIITSDI